MASPAAFRGSKGKPRTAKANFCKAARYTATGIRNIRGRELYILAAPSFASASGAAASIFLQLTGGGFIRVRERRERRKISGGAPAIF